MSYSSYITALLYMLVAFLIASCGATPPVDQEPKLDIASVSSDIDKSG